MRDALDPVIDAALERARVDCRDDSSEWRDDGADGRDDSAPAVARARRSDDAAPLTAALTSIAALSALEQTSVDGIDPDVWTPGSRQTRSELVAAGAATAYRRFDVDLDVVVERSGVSRTRLDRFDVPIETRH